MHSSRHNLRSVVVNILPAMEEKERKRRIFALRDSKAHLNWQNCPPPPFLRKSKP